MNAETICENTSQRTVGFSSHQQRLHDFFTDGSKGWAQGTDDHPLGILGIRAPTRFDSLEEAQESAYEALSKLPDGYEFTVMGLFRHWKIKGRDPRVRGALLFKARKERLIRSCGITQEDQEGRNKGLATKWMVVRE